MPGLDPNAVHVINGDAAAATFQQAIASTSRMIVSRDVLSCGPIVAFTDIEAWKEARVAFWREVLAHDSRIDLRPAQAGLWENLARLAAAPRIYAWVAGGNTDQLFLVFLLELLERIDSDPGKVELIEFLRLPPSDRRVMAMAELDGYQMRLHPAPRPLGIEEWTSYRQAWQALSSEDPFKVQCFPGDCPQASEHLKAALRHVLRRYPDRASGLDYWDRQILDDVRARGPRAGRVIGHTLGEHRHEGDLIHEAYFFWRLLRMASPELPSPLLTLVGDLRSMQDANVELTAFGAQVLQGEASAWPVNPIDDWAGGVHLSSAEGNLWFVDGGRLYRA